MTLLPETDDEPTWQTWCGVEVKFRADPETMDAVRAAFDEGHPFDFLMPTPDFSTADERSNWLKTTRGTIYDAAPCAAVPLDAEDDDLPQRPASEYIDQGETLVLRFACQVPPERPMRAMMKHGSVEAIFAPDMYRLYVPTNRPIDPEELPPDNEQERDRRQ
jgi:hypothetical protein